MHLSLMFDARARSGPGSRTRGKTPSKSTIGRIRRAQKKLAALGEVDVLTAGDNDVCPVCEAISEDGPYSLDTAEDLIPAHPFCRCAFVPAGTLQDSAWWDFDPDQPRDPHGRWTFAGGPSGEHWQKVADDALKEWGAEHPKVQAKTVELNRDLDTIMAEAAKFEHFKDWYDEQRPLLEKYFGEDWKLFAKFLSAASIQGGGKVNVGRALDAYAHFKLGGSFEEGQYTGVMNLHREQFKKAVEGELSGPKIVPFEKALTGDLSQVVVDRWMKRLLFKSPVDKGGSPQVPATQVIIKAMADKMGWKPAQLQAALWAVAMTRGGEKPWSLKKILADNEARIRSLMHTVHAFSDAIIDSGVPVLLSKLADAYRDARLLVTLFEGLQKAGAPPFNDFNPYHAPAGSPEGGQFTSGESAGGPTSEQVAAIVAKQRAGTEPLDPKVTDVGGDEWNRQTAVRLEREFQSAKPQLEKIAAAAVEKGAATSWGTKVGEPPPDDEDAAFEKLMNKGQQEEEDDDASYIPESWDDISGDKQDEIFNDWKEKTHDDFLQDEINNWQENGDAMDDTKGQLAYKLDGHSGDNQYAFDALNEMRDQRKEDGVEEIPFTNEQLMDAMSFDYEGGYGGTGDVKITWNDDKLGLPKGWVSEQGTLPGIEPLQPSSKLTKEMHEDIEAALKKAFNDEAENKVGDAEPPEYLNDNVGEYQDQSWDGKSDKEKFKWAQKNGHIEEPESESLSDKPTTLYKMPDKIDPLGERDKTRDYQLTKLLAEKMSVGRAADLMVQRGVFQERAHALRAAHDFDGRLWRSWKQDSASADGMLLQAATAAELGGRFRNPLTNLPPLDSNYYTDVASSRFGSAGGWDGMKAYIRAKWETSQYLLDKANKPEVEVYRAIMLKDKGREEEMKIPQSGYNFPFHFTRLPDLPLNRSGAQSTTADIGVANTWKGVGAAAKGFDPGKDRVVFRMRVPRTAVLSLPAYGQNLYGEHEVIVAGTAWKKWDAWLHHAPDFREFSMKDAREMR